MGRELEPAGILTTSKDFNFSFNKFEKEYESYYGIGVKLRYFIRVSIFKNHKPKVIKELDFAVLLYQEADDKSFLSIAPETFTHKLDVGIEECLHIEFDYNSQTFHLKDVLKGIVKFKLVRIKVKSMQIDIIKKEILESVSNQNLESETLTKYEVMDGCPSKDEEIPIRIFFTGTEITPTYNKVSGKFTVKYMLNLVLIDEDDRRYFKQQEIVFWRKTGN